MTEAPGAAEGLLPSSPLSPPFQEFTMGYQNSPPPSRPVGTIAYGDAKGIAPDGDQEPWGGSGRIPSVRSGGSSVGGGSPGERGTGEGSKLTFARRYR